MLAVAALVSIAVTPDCVAAQQIHGTAVLFDSTTRASGIVIVASDAGGNAVARALTSQSGDFVLRLPGAGRYTLHALHIGFRPTVVAPLDIAPGEDRSLKIVLGNEPVAIAAVRVRGDNVCNIKSGTGKAVVDLWDQVRTALTATQLTSAGPGLEAEVVEYQRMERQATHVIEAETSVVKHMHTTHVFVSMPTDTLAARGYIVPDATGLVYSAPDPDVLLSESFASQHCFHVEPAPRAHSDWIGIGFESARDRAGIHDIKGTVWLDRATARLQRLDYSYTNLDYAIAEGTVGSFLNFLALPSGQWIVSEWAIRMPTAVQAGPNGRSSQATSIEIAVAGGLVVHVLRGESALYSAPGANVDVRLVQHDSLFAAPGSYLAIAGTGRTTVAAADSHGHFDGVLPGNYMLRVRVPAMERIGAPAMEHAMTVPADTPHVAINFDLPNEHDVMRAACGDALSDGALVFGVVFGPEKKPAAGAQVQLSWLSTRGGKFDNVNLQTASDNAGRWRICNVPVGQAMTATVKLARTELARAPILVPNGWSIARFDLPDATPKHP